MGITVIYRLLFGGLLVLFTLNLVGKEGEYTNELFEDLGVIDLGYLKDDLDGYYLNVALEEMFRKGEKRSRIRWRDLKEKKFLDFLAWKKEAILKESDPFYEINEREKVNKELVGRVLSCIGICLGHRNEGETNIQYRSKIIEGDEVETLEDSYSWIYINDGTLIRLSPRTSIALREINIGINKSLIHIRINFGNILWISRKRSLLNFHEGRETDTIFLPLALQEANTPLEKTIYGENKLYESFKKTYDYKSQYLKLNNMIQKNNEFSMPKKSLAFVVMPNGNVLGQDLFMEFHVELGGSSFLKLRSFKAHNQQASSNNSVYYYYRGYTNKESFNVKEENWYHVDPRGREINIYEKNEFKLGMGELLTKRIPSILLARELMFERYSLDYFRDDLNFISLGKMGYRFWDEKKDEFKNRINYLKERTRREETSLLLSSIVYRKKLLKRDKHKIGQSYNCSYFERGLLSYSANGEKFFEVPTRENIKLQRENNYLSYIEKSSRKKRYWLKLKERRERFVVNEKKKILFSTCK